MAAADDQEHRLGNQRLDQDFEPLPFRRRFRDEKTRSPLAPGQTRTASAPEIQVLGRNRLLGQALNRRRPTPPGLEPW